MDRRPTLLLTAGPTHEPIDAVRFVGNRSSGRMGLAIARAAAARSWRTTLLLGPIGDAEVPVDSHLTVHRFRTTAELGDLLEREWPTHDILIMAAAVADFRPRAASAGKIRRSENLVLELEPTEDLVARMSERRREGQIIVGFALEPVEGLHRAAKAKMAKKGLDAIVANPLETMGADRIEAHLLKRTGQSSSPDAPAPLTKADFAEWLLGQVERLWSSGGA